MTRAQLPRALRGRQRGAGLIETMIGILIGLLVVLVVYNLLAVAEGYRRATVGASDAQITGLLSQFVTGHDAGNGGNGLTSGFTDLMTCNFPEPTVGLTFKTDRDPTGGPATLKPIPILIYPGENPWDSDSFVSRLATSPHVIWPLDMRSVAGVSPAAGANITVSSPLGYSTVAGASLPTAASPFWAIAIANDGTGHCALIQITNASPPDGNGITSLTQGTLKTTIDYTGVPVTASVSGARILNLGRDANRSLYDIANDSLRITDCLPTQTCEGVAANPIAQNVVWMKVQYGIDTTQQNANGTLDGSVDCWTAAEAGTCTATNRDGTTYDDWTAGTLITAGGGAVRSDVINRIVAVRIGLVVRSDEPDLRNPALYIPASVVPDGTGTTNGTRQPVYLFNCATNTDAACQNRVLVPAGAPSALDKSDCATASNTVLCDGWRYRTYEAVIPLRNAIYNATLIP